MYQAGKVSENSNFCSKNSFQPNQNFKSTLIRFSIANYIITKTVSKQASHRLLRKWHPKNTRHPRLWKNCYEYAIKAVRKQLDNNPAES